MEKLIELLNEYERERKDCSKWDRFDLTIYEKGICLAISKSYWFIKWLVENDKIDLEKVKVLSVFQETWYYNKYESLLMILAIQDEPIEFLISILK